MDVKTPTFFQMIEKLSIFRPLLLCKAAAIIAMSPAAYPQIANLAFEHYSIDQGLSGPTVPCIIQDSIGYLWFGVWIGVDRFDGYSFTSYRHDPDDASSLTKAFVETLFEDRAGNIWAGTQKGLDRLDRATGKFTHFMPHPPRPGPQPGNFVRSILEDRFGVLWVGTSDGLNILDRSSGKFTCLRHDSTNPGSLIDNRVEALAEDQAGSLWIGTSGGLDRLDRQTNTFVHCWPKSENAQDYTATSSASNSVNCIHVERPGHLWLGTDQGLIEFDHVTQSVRIYRHDPVNPRSLSSNSISSIAEDGSGDLWIGTYRDGLNVLDRKTRTFTRVLRNEQDPRSLSSNAIRDVYCERSGTIWVATQGASVNKLNRPKPIFTTYPYDAQLPAFILSGVLGDNTGKMWVYTTNLWKKFDPSTGVFESSPLRDGYHPLRNDRQGNLWMGGNSGGLCIQDTRGRIHDFVDSTGITFRDRVRCLIESHDGRFWLGTDEGLFVANHDTRIVTRIPQPASRVMALLEDRYGVLWYGTWDDGLLSYDPAANTVTRHSIDLQDSMSAFNRPILVLHEDRSGTLWVVSEDLFMLDRSTGLFTHIGAKDGLPAPAAMILEDDHGNLWVSTMSGLSRFEPGKKRFTTYYIPDGLQHNAFAFKAGYRGTNGEMFFAGTKGLTRFHPDSIRDNPYIPPVIVTSMRTIDQPIPLAKEIHLPYSDNSITFEFVALSFVIPERNRYAYMMEGLDRDWVQCGTRRYASYSHLEPGEYVFRVRGSNNDGVWNEGGAAISVIVTPPFWKRWWFVAFFWLAIAAVIGGTARYIEMRKLKREIARLEQQRTLERERARISMDMHDEVGANLTKIAIMSELAITSPGGIEGVSVYLRSISQIAREVIDSISAIVWSINPRNDGLDNLAGYLREYVSETLEVTSIKYSFDFPDDVPSLPLAPEVRRNVFLATKEAINNVMKHSRASRVAISLRLSGGRLELTLEDNGAGFVLQGDQKRGNGLINMRKRVEEIGGTFEIVSEPGRGTTIRLAVRVTPTLLLS